MRVSIEASSKDIAPAFDWINALIGVALSQRVSGFQQQERKNPLLTNHFRMSFGLEFAMAQARTYRKNTSRLPRSLSE